MNAQNKKTRFTPLDYARGNAEMTNFLKQNGASASNLPEEEYGKITAERFTLFALKAVEGADGSCCAPVSDSGMWMIQWTPKRISDMLDYGVRIAENTKGFIEFASKSEARQWLEDIYKDNIMNKSFYAGASEMGRIVPVK